MTTLFMLIMLYGILYVVFHAIGFLFHIGWRLFSGIAGLIGCFVIGAFLIGAGIILYLIPLLLIAGLIYVVFRPGRSIR